MIRDSTQSGFLKFEDAELISTPSQIEEDKVPNSWTRILKSDKPVAANLSYWDEYSEVMPRTVEKVRSHMTDSFLIRKNESGVCLLVNRFYRPNHDLTSFMISDNPYTARWKPEVLKILSDLPTMYTRFMFELGDGWNRDFDPMRGLFGSQDVRPLSDDLTIDPNKRINKGKLDITKTYMLAGRRYKSTLCFELGASNDISYLKWAGAYAGERRDFWEEMDGVLSSFF